MSTKEVSGIPVCHQSDVMMLFFYDHFLFACNYIGYVYAVAANPNLPECMCSRVNFADTSKPIAS